MGYSIPDNRGLAPVFTNMSVLKTSGGMYPRGGEDLARWFVPTVFNLLITATASYESDA